jgi:hypothetical protein
VQENSTLHDEMKTLLHEFSLLSQVRHQPQLVCDD